MPKRTREKDQFEIDWSSESRKYGGSQPLDAAFVLLARHSFLDFIRAVAPFFIIEEVHVLIARALEDVLWGHNDRLMVFQSPRSGKSTLINVLFPAFWFGHLPGDKIMTCSHSIDLAGRFGGLVRDLMNTQAYKQIFPKAIVESGSERHWKLVATSEGHEAGEYVAAGTGKSIAGMGFNLGIGDDLLSEQHAESKRMKDKAELWYRNGFYTRRQLERNAIILGGTRWAFDDVPGRLLEEAKHSNNSDVWRVIRIPAYLDSEAAELVNNISASDIIMEGTRKILVPGKSFAPRRFPEREIERSRATLTQRSFSAQYLQKPSEDDGVILKRSSWRLWPPRKALPECHMIVNCWDTAIEDDEGADYSACTTWGIFDSISVGRDNREYEQSHVLLLHAWRGRIKALDLLTRAKEIQKETQSDMVLVEKRASGHQLIQELKRSGVHVRAWLPPGIRGTRGKVPRAHSASISLDQGCVWYPDRAWAEEVIGECMPAGTQIVTRDGLIPIEDIRPGDMVLTHKGRWRPVIAQWSREASEIIKIKGKTLDEISLTPNHPIFGAAVGSAKKAHGRANWIDAKDIKGRSYRQVLRKGKPILEADNRAHNGIIVPNVVRENPIDEIDLRQMMQAGGSRFLPMDSGDDIFLGDPPRFSMKWRQKLDYDFGRFLGLYVAEGSTSAYQVAYSFGSHEQHLADFVVRMAGERLGVRARSRPLRSVIQVEMGAALTGALYGGFGSLAHEKRLPPWVWDAPDRFKRGLLDGYAEGDGSMQRGLMSCSTASRTLAWHIRLLAQNLGLKPSVRKVRDGGVGKVEGREVTTKDVYSVSWRQTMANDGAGYETPEGLLYSIMSKSESSGPVTVYNMSVLDDESYTTTGGCVHNCSQFPFGQHKDYVDTVTMMLIYLRKNFHLDTPYDEPEDDELELMMQIEREDSRPRRLYGAPSTSRRETPISDRYGHLLEGVTLVD